MNEAVQDSLKQFILDNRLRPGDPLPPEGELAKRLGVGRNTIREAVKSLSALGIIEVRVGVGLWVRGFDLEPMLDGLTYAMLSDLKRRGEVGEVRNYLELGSAADVVELASESQLERMAALLAEWKPIAQGGVYSSQHDRRFHELLWENLNNQFLSQILEAFWDARHRVAEAIGLRHPPNLFQHYRVHQSILDALRERDLELFIGALKEHHRGLARRTREPGDGRKYEVGHSSRTRVPR
jgi:DNA-binding FadR family transcriptional regulator